MHALSRARGGYRRPCQGTERPQSCRRSLKPVKTAALWSRPARLYHCKCSVSTDAVVCTDGGGGGVSGAGIGKDGGGGGGGDEHNDGGDGSGTPDPAVLAFLAAAGRTMDSLPKDFAAGILSGKVTVEVLKRFLDLEKQLFIGFLMGFAGFRERLLADPSFMLKVGIEVGIGVFTKLSAEYAKRQDYFWREIDFVGANCLMAIIADFMLVWLPAPTLSYVAAKNSKNFLVAAFAGCPDNAFQKVQPGMPSFSVAQRFGAVVRNGLKLLGVGLTASFVGVAMANTLIALRSALDPTFVATNKPQNVFATSLAYGVYMATSSNLRYQLLAGVIEERGIETVFKGNYAVSGTLSFVVRTLNTFVGSLLWVDFVRLLGMQKAQGH